MSFPSISCKDHTILILPFTHSLLLSPETLISTILSTLPTSSKKSFTVVFTSPTSPQLYGSLLQTPVKHFDIFQSFLGRIYAALATAQLNAGRVLMDVEVHFDGENGPWAEKLFHGREVEDYQILVIEGVILPTQVKSIINSIPQTVLPPIPVHDQKPDTTADSTSPSPAVVALGGTFDHLHAAHKLLLHSSLFLSTRKLIVGLVSDSLLTSKSHHELVQPLAERKFAVERFLQRIGGGKVTGEGESEQEGVELDIGEIHDGLGPTRYDPDIHALVVSKETFSGGQLVNNTRKQNGLNELDIFVVNVISDKDQLGSQLESELDEKKLKELKMGSTGIRNWIYQQSQLDSQST
ncbi:uncharacterized protein IL334_004065 [Kwoniella shivajii]|uniref:Cytidyltransferase-like domain-containing protein n=1 Tax=Kwoniella shivajii TaxID=564305 RepID=A0ABZ1D155_9TREE|nr:hypothetical protein IL334_004065 [Kwoniella shivajii]